MNAKNTAEYLKSEFGVVNADELQEIIKNSSDLDIGLFVTPLPWEELRGVAQ